MDEINFYSSSCEKITFTHASQCLSSFHAGIEVSTSAGSFCEFFVRTRKLQNKVRIFPTQKNLPHFTYISESVVEHMQVFSGFASGIKYSTVNSYRRPTLVGGADRMQKGGRLDPKFILFSHYSDYANADTERREH